MIVWRLIALLLLTVPGVQEAAVETARYPFVTHHN